jgi:DNA-binding CsgD family transcriptional regulator
MRAVAGRSLIGELAGVSAGLVGRDTILDRLDRSLDAPGAVVCGPGAVGVSALLGAVARRRRTRDVVLHHLVAGDPLDGLVGVGDDVATQPTPILILDDAHLLDDEPAASLRRAVLAGRLRCLLGSTDSSHLPAPLTWLWQSGTLERVDVEPLDGSDVADWVAARVGARPDRSTLDALMVDGGGLPGLMVDCLRGLTAEGAVDRLALRSGYARLSGALPCPPSLVQRVGRRIEGLSPDARFALESVCVTGHLAPSPGAARLTEDWVADLVRRGLVRSQGLPGRPVLSPFVGAIRRVVLSDLGARGIARTAARLLVEVPDAAPLDRALWSALAESGAGLSAEVASVAAVARRLMAERRLDEAEVLARSAADRGDLEATVVLAELRSERADWAGSAELLTELLDHPDLDPDVRTGAVAELAALLLWDFDQADRAVALANADVEATGGVGGAGTPTLIELTVQAGRVDQALALIAQLDGGRYDLKTQGAAALARGLGGDLDGAVELAEQGLARCLDPGPDDAPHEPESHVLALALSLTESGRMDEAARLAEAGYELAGSHPPDVAWMALARGRVALVAGNLAAAEQFGREAEAIFGDLDDRAPWGWALATQLFVAGLRGDAGACAVLRPRLEAVERSGVRFLDADLARARAWADHAAGDTLGARRRLTDAGEAAETLGNRALALVVWHDALRLGDGELAPAALARLVPRVGGSASAAVALHLRAVRSAADPSHWLRAARAMAQAGRTVQTAELATQAVERARRRGDRATVREARELLDRASAVCAGARTPLLVAVDVSLTRREREVAQLAASGVASRRIAAELGVSVRTVDNLLGRAYAKLGVRSRRELATVLAPDLD